MKKFLILALFASVLTFGFSNDAHAGKFMFGKKQDVNRIEDIELQGPKGEDLFLAHMTETQFFGLGVYMKDAGYVLGIKGDYGAYYPMLEGDKLEMAQAAGVLPSPLPEYKIEPMDWAFGYSLWIVLIVIGVWTGAQHLMDKRKSGGA